MKTAVRDFLDQAGPYFLAALVHAVAAGLLVLAVEWPVRKQSAPEAADAVQATVVDEERVRLEIERIRERETAKRRAEEERAEAARQQREHEERRRKEAEAARLAEEQRRKEAETARAEEERRRQEAQTARLAEEQRRKEAETAARRAREQQRKELEKARRRNEVEMARRKAEEKRRVEQAEAERRKQEEERARRERMAREKQRLEQQREAIFAKAREEYIDAIESRVTSNWRRPTGIPDGLKCRVYVVQDSSGKVLRVEIGQSSGNVAFDRSVEQAVLAASPLPRPRQRAVFDREIVFLFHPRS